MFYQLNLQTETALVSCPEQRRSCAGSVPQPRRQRRPFLQIPSPGLQLTAGFVFGFPFSIPWLRFPRLQANIQPLLPLLFSKKEKHSEKKLPGSWAVFKAERKAAPGAAHAAGSAPARAPGGLSRRAFCLGLLFQANITVLFPWWVLGLGCPQRAGGFSVRLLLFARTRSSA